jgi:predicted membrane channel-forming protein YqfA (hemolysin III family)
MATAHPFTPNPSDPQLVAHERTYKVFNIILRWSMVHLASLIAFLTLWFATDAGFIAALVVGVVIFVLGYNFLVKHEEHQPLDVWQEGR